MQYMSVNTLPEKYKSVVGRMIASGVLQLENDKTIHVSYDMLEMFIILGRLGLV